MPWMQRSNKSIGSQPEESMSVISDIHCRSSSSTINSTRRFPRAAEGSRLMMPLCTSLIPHPHSGPKRHFSGADDEPAEGRRALCEVIENMLQSKGVFPYGQSQELSFPLIERVRQKPQFAFHEAREAFIEKQAGEHLRVQHALDNGRLRVKKSIADLQGERPASMQDEPFNYHDRIIGCESQSLLRLSPSLFHSGFEDANLQVLWVHQNVAERI